MPRVEARLLLVVVSLVAACTDVAPGAKVTTPLSENAPAPSESTRPAAAGAPDEPADRSEAGELSPIRLILQLSPALADAFNDAASRGEDFQKWAWPEELRALNDAFSVRTVSPVLPPGTASPQKLEALRQAYAQRTGRADLRAPLPRLDAFFLFELPAQLDPEELSASYGALADVVTVEPEQEVRISADTFSNPTQQWGLYQVNAPSAWGWSTGAGVNVAVIDTGVALSHPDLAPKILPGASFVPGVPTPNDDNGHGSHVAGVIAAVTNNSLGIAAVAPDANIIPVKALNLGGSGLTPWLQNAYVWAMSTGYTDVINNSWGGGGTSPMLEASMQAAHAMGIITINAAGNAASPTYGFFPSNIEYGLSVAATDIANAPAGYSNTGVKLDVAAPGGSASGTVTTGVLSTVHAGFSGAGVLVEAGAKYAPLAGTSMAAPHVSGLAALLIAAHPTWTVEQLRQAIRKGATDVHTPGFDIQTGYGRINATATMMQPEPPSAQIISPRNTHTVVGTATVKGFALPSTGYAANWTLYAGAGTAPTSWTPLAAGAAIHNDTNFTSFNSLVLPDGDHTLRLVTTEVGTGKTAEDRNLIHVDNVAISSPVDGSHLTAGVIPIWGRAQGTLGFNSWKLEWANGYNATTGFTTIATGTSQVPANSLFTNWSLSPVPEGEITLRLTAQFASHASSHQVNVIVDKRVLPGFPAKILDPMGFKSPKIVDLDKDGRMEIVIGDSVYQGNGMVRPGWTPDPKLGRTVPAIANIDSDPALEIVNISFESYFYDSTLPGGGAPVVKAYNHDKTVLWTYPVLHTVGTYHNGTPSSVSIANVTGNARLEVVFTHFFAHNNPLQKTTVFILDASSGTLINRFEVPGFTWSSVALANLDNDNYAELIFETYESSTSAGRTWAFNADGTLVPGWPQVSASSQGFASISPVVADVDNDCRYEVLVGSTLYRRNGVPFPGWPVSLIARSTGAIANLDGDAPLEIALGGGNSVTSWLTENNAALNLATTNTFENLLVIGFNENYTQGNPLLADVDGDGKVDLIRPSELGSTDPLRGMPIYAYDLATSAKKPQTRRVRTTEPSGNYSFPSYSTGALGDINGDGRLDLVVVARNTVWAWNLGVPYVPSKAPWPMYQRDLQNTGTVPLGGMCGIIADPLPSLPLPL